MKMWRNVRFLHVAESIALTTIFTTLKYYPANKELFKERLLRYARPLDKQSDSTLIFEYVRIAKAQHKFEYIPIVEYHINPKTWSLREQILSKVYSVNAIEDGSPIHVGSKSGSYAPSPEE